MPAELVAQLASDLACALDPAALAAKIGMPPDPWEADFLRSADPRVLLNCSRQSGKSTVTALLGVHTALYEPGALVLLLSPSLRQSQELFRKALDTYRALANPVPVEAESALRLELENGSRIVSLPGKEQTVRGFSGVRLLAVDEAARVPNDLYFAIRPMLAVSGGRLVALSTPFGTRGWWFEAWDGTNGWAVGDHNEADDPDAQDAADAEALYRVLEDEVVPLFYERDARGIPGRWLARVRASLKTLLPVFNTHRMVREYTERIYLDVSE